MYFRIRAPPRSPRGTSQLGSPPGPPSSLEVGPSPLARVYPAGRGGPGSPPIPVGPRNHPGTIPEPSRNHPPHPGRVAGRLARPGAPRPGSRPTRPNPAGYPAGYRFEPKTRAGRVGPGRPGSPPRSVGPRNHPPAGSAGRPPGWPWFRNHPRAPGRVGGRVAGRGGGRDSRRAARRRPGGTPRDGPGMVPGP